MKETPNLRQPTGLIVPPTPDTCGNCRYGKLIQIGATECWGLPPTPVVLGQRQGLGGVEANIELLRPRLASNTAGCALWREKGLDLMASEGRG